MKNTLCPIIGFLIFLLLSLTIPYSLDPNNSVQAQNVETGYFEGEVPINGAYLQTINCDPRFSRDENDDGILDPGYTLDFDEDGSPETRYVVEPLIVDLAAHGFYPGDVIMISCKRSIHNLIHDNVYGWPLYGLFSSSPELITENWIYTPQQVSDPYQGDKKWPMIGPVNRVPGAIDAALGGYNHHQRLDDTNLWKQGTEVENDIPEDFQVRGYSEWNEGGPGETWSEDKWIFNNGFYITIPPEAKYLFFQGAASWRLNHNGYFIVTIDKDTDKDSIPDFWEKTGIDFNKDGMLDYVLPDANYLHKDLYVEIDYMGASGDCQGHKPNIDALNDVILAFNEAPAQSVKNPDDSKGITLHIDTNGWDQIVHRDIFEAFADFHEIKETTFGTAEERADQNSRWILLAKKWTHRYCMFVHQYFTEEEGEGMTISTSSGLAELGGNDFLVSLGSWDTNPGTRDEQAATFMHELGHTLGLQHGGGDGINYKPNYLSIMNYMFTYNWNVGSRPLDYSRKALDPLDENALDDLKGLGVNQINTYSSPWYETAHSLYAARLWQLRVTLFMPIDWVLDDVMEPDNILNVNNFPQWGYESPLGEVLYGWDDWVNLEFYFQEGGLFAEGAEPLNLENEITYELATKIREAIEQNEHYPVPESDSTMDTDDTADTEKSNVETTMISNEVIIIVAFIVVIGVILFVVIRKRK